MSTGQSARQRSSSSGTRPPVRTTTPLHPQIDVDVQPCAATASIFLFAQGKSIVCLHHDSLDVERRFEKHNEQVVLLSVDNVSERGAGRLVASYDAGQTAIVWDLFTGDEIARFASYEPLKVAAWMKNGNVAFGNTRGEVITFEPSTSEHRSARTIFDPITALAPASDCQTYAIGYTNGSILIVALQPTFTILHTLSTSLAPSPIVGLAWHASSTKQKSDMLAVQSGDGDLRVWSIAKAPAVGTPQVIRTLKRGDNVEAGLNWIAWSKNGRIIQFSQGETWAWDVRTKHVAYEPVPTVDGVVALANFGPTATLFTLGPNNTVQQYDLCPPTLVKNVRHDPMSMSTPKTAFPSTSKVTIPGAAPPVPIYKGYDPSRGAASLSTIQRAAHDSSVEHARRLRNEMGSPVSTTSRTESINSHSSIGYRHRAPPSASSRAGSGTTFSTFSPSMVARDSLAGLGSYYAPTASVASSGRHSSSRGSRLRQEVLLSPEGHLIDLFPYARARLASLPYSPQQQPLDQTKTPAAELRRQMLQVVFGWDGDISDMIQDEMSHHPPGSMNATLLGKWLGKVNEETMASAMDSDAMTETDWMMLALSQMNGEGTASRLLGQKFAKRLLQQGDIHTAATVFLGIGDSEDAIDIYISRNYFMEGILLTCLLFPEDWQKQSQLVRRWGEYVIENSQQQLAIRCFSCTGVDASIPWASPTQSPFAGSQAPQRIPELISPPISPPPDKSSGPSRMTTKNSSLKLITSFGQDPAQQFKFPGLITDDRTPTNVVGVTPIAESAISPDGTPTTFLRPRQKVKTPSGHGHMRNRLPSIGETPIDANPPSFPQRPAALPTPNDSGSDKEKELENSNRSSIVPQEARLLPQTVEPAPLTLSSARYNPTEEATPQATPQTALPKTAIRTWSYDIQGEEKPRTRSGSRQRKPDGLHIQMPSLDQMKFKSYTDSSKNESPIHHRSDRSSAFPSSGSNSGRSDTGNDIHSPLGTGSSWASSTKSPSVSGRSMDQFISSLSEAHFYAKKQKEKSRADGGRREQRSRSKPRNRDASNDRGRGGHRYIRPAKRSPSSPVPMSPEDLQKYRDLNSQSIESQISSSSQLSMDSSPEQDSHPNLLTARKGRSKNRSHSKVSDLSHGTVRRISPSGRFGSEADPGSKFNSRLPSPDGLLSPNTRGRSKSKTGGSAVRSPSSPLPMSPQARLYRDDAPEDDALRLVEADRQRVRSSHRSTSRRPKERGLSTKRDPSSDRRGMEERQTLSTSEISPRKESATESKLSDGEKAASDGGHTLTRTKSHRSLKKEMAARELEARRVSLAQRSMTPVTYPPVQPTSRPPISRAQTDLGNSPTSASVGRMGSPINSYGAMMENAMMAADPVNRAASAGPYGLPSTPRAMRHPRYQSREDSIPAVPELPDSFNLKPIEELPRSMSVPIPESENATPSDMPRHPAFHQGLRPSAQRPNFMPLNEIGKHRRTSSYEAQQVAMAAAGIASIEETLHEANERPDLAPLVIPDQQQPPLLPELQHLASPIPPPPPPPPPFMTDEAHHSMSSGSGVGTINIVMDDTAINGPTVEVINTAKDNGNSNNNNKELPPQPRSRVSSPPISSSGHHRRSRSIDNFGSKIKGFTERMRSTSRGRNNGNPTRSPEPAKMPSPYESRVQFF